VRRVTAGDKKGTEEATSGELPASALAWIVDGYRALGLDLSHDATELGLSPDALVDDPQRVIPRASYAGLLRRALSRRPDFAVQAGLRCPFGTFSLLDCTTAACASLGEAIASLVRYASLVTRNGRFRLVDGALELVPEPGLPAWFWVASFEFGLHYTAARLDELIAREAVRAIEVPWSAPPWSSAYPRPTRFDAPRAAMILHDGVLAAVSGRADPLVAALLARNAATVLAEMPRSPTVRSRVHEAVVGLLPRGLPTMERVARELATSPRTLRRRLADEDMTFERVRDEALSAIARERLRDRRQSIAEVAYVLGFSEVRSFHRSFRRWTGVTPGEFRRLSTEASPADPGASLRRP
jgi:AraC-like DNA-binding protein